jgi:hypothetical protein
LNGKSGARTGPRRPASLCWAPCRAYGTLGAVDLASLAHFAGRFRDSEKRTEVLRRELAEAIRQAHKDGLAQKEIAEATGYTRQQIRRIVLTEDRDD